MQRILAVHSGALGDCILFGHLLARLGGNVTLIAGLSKAQLLAGLSVVDGAMDFDALPIHEVFSDQPLTSCRLPELLGRYGRLVSCFAGGDRRAELRLAAMCQATTASFLPIRPPDGSTAHLVELWADMLGLSFAGPAGPDTWPVPDQWRSQATGALGELGIDSQRPYVVMHPGAGSPAKCWPLENFLRLAGRQEQTVVVTGPVEADLWPASRTEALGKGIATLSCPDLNVLAGAVAGASAYIGNDSGPSHLAAAIGTPTVALFGPTRPEHFAPRGQAVRTIRCEPIDSISVEQVSEALADLRC